MSNREFEIAIDDVPGGYAWRIEVGGETIAQSHGLRFAFPREAHNAAVLWAQHHERSGYPFQKDWWQIAY